MHLVSVLQSCCELEDVSASCSHPSERNLVEYLYVHHADGQHRCRFAGLHPELAGYKLLNVDALAQSHELLTLHLRALPEKPPAGMCAEGLYLHNASLGRITDLRTSLSVQF